MIHLTKNLMLCLDNTSPMGGDTSANVAYVGGVGDHVFSNAPLYNSPTLESAIAETGGLEPLLRKLSNTDDINYLYVCEDDFISVLCGFFKGIYPNADPDTLMTIVNAILIDMSCIQTRRPRFIDKHRRGAELLRDIPLLDTEMLKSVPQPRKFTTDFIQLVPFEYMLPHILATEFSVNPVSSAALTSFNDRMFMSMKKSAAALLVKSRLGNAPALTEPDELIAYHEATAAKVSNIVNAGWGDMDLIAYIAHMVRDHNKSIGYVNSNRLNYVDMFLDGDGMTLQDLKNIIQSDLDNGYLTLFQRQKSNRGVSTLMVGLVLKLELSKLKTFEVDHVVPSW